MRQICPHLHKSNNYWLKHFETYIPFYLPLSLTSFLIPLLLLHFTFSPIRSGSLMQSITTIHMSYWHEGVQQLLFMLIKIKLTRFFFFFGKNLVILKAFKTSRISTSDYIFCLYQHSVSLIGCWVIFQRTMASYV